MNVLFICNQNQNRSKTAEEIFRHKFNAKSAGLYNEKPVTARQLEFADLIVVMEEDHRQELGNRFPNIYLKKQILCFNIPDIYYYMQPELVKLLNTKMSELLKPLVE